MRLPLALLLVLALSGCSDGGDGDPDPDDGDPAPDDGGDGSGVGDGGDGQDGDEGDDGGGADDGNATQRRDPVTWTVSIEGNDFVDGSLTIQVGDTVVWSHADGTVPHTVTADDGAFDSGACPGTTCMTELQNAQFSFTFDGVGEFPYHCEVHPSMTDTVTVLERSDGVP